MQNKEPIAAEPAGRPRGRRTLLLVAAVFMLPVVVSTALYLADWRPSGRALQHGELLNPPRPLGDALLEAADGTTLRLADLAGQWALVYFARLPCDDRCQQGLYTIQQVRLTQGRDARRVERLFIALAPAEPALRTGLAARYPGLRVLQAPAPVLGSLAGRFVSATGSARDDSGRIYVVDPNGNLVISYPADADPSGMRRDLARLLRLSQIG